MEAYDVIIDSASRSGGILSQHFPLSSSNRRLLRLILGASIRAPSHQILATPLHSFVRSFVHSFIQSFVHSFIHSFTDSLTHSLSQLLTYSFIVITRTEGTIANKQTRKKNNRQELIRRWDTRTWHHLIWLLVYHWTIPTTHLDLRNIFSNKYLLYIWWT